MPVRSHGVRIEYVIFITLFLWSVYSQCLISLNYWKNTLVLWRSWQEVSKTVFGDSVSLNILCIIRALSNSLEVFLTDQSTSSFWNNEGWKKKNKKESADILIRHVSLPPWMHQRQPWASSVISGENHSERGPHAELGDKIKEQLGLSTGTSGATPPGPVI